MQELVAQKFAVSCVKIQVLTHLLVKVTRPGDSKEAFSLHRKQFVLLN